MLSTTYKSQLNTAAVARRIAQRTIADATKTIIGSFDKLIVARVFTAFMFEGVLHHLGETLCATWNNKPAKGPSFAFEPVIDRHKRIRRLLKLDSGGNEYRQIEAIVSGLIDFRDSLAHPKVIEETGRYEGPPPDLMNRPALGWEADVEVEKVRSDYETIEEYCRRLLDAAADAFDSEIKISGLGSVLGKYPQLNNEKLNVVIAQLRGFVDNTKTGGFHSTYREDAGRN